MKQLNDILPYVTFGMPSKEIVHDLIMKVGQIYDEKKGTRITIKSNVIVEEILGNIGLICIEDIIDILTKNPCRKIDNDINNEKNERKY